jgi:hypothetical protein
MPGAKFDLTRFNPKTHILPKNRAARMALASYERKAARVRETKVQAAIERAVRPFVGQVTTPAVRARITNAVVRALHGVVPYKEVLALLESTLGPVIESEAAASVDDAPGS